MRLPSNTVFISAKILLFYLLFYAVLIGFFSAMLAVFYQTLDMKKPKWQLSKSLIGDNPGLGFRPMPPESNVESTLIWYKSSDKGNVHYWKNELTEFVKSYDKENNPHEKNVEECTNYQPPSEGKVCNVKMTKNIWHPCLAESSFGFEDEKGGPCIFLKLNKIYNWNPEYYNSTSLPQDPNAMSEYLRKDIVDAESRGEDGYMSPLIAVHFEAPRRGILINIECKAWARNIIHDRVDRRGSVHFELMVD
ncbi:hypothetical protein NQ318_001462 [Aromia moschata]|uniref:Sodium/potassium-transporting ATPase subunit beta-2 n=1 Tax=Aromia moschata TaxID=1265417 RepID=A0AAV8YX67_9CUCU|nr:hypothetical protein NQ318_001462 [Aromia moschata]